MYKFNIVLFFYIFGIIYLVETQDPGTLEEESVKIEDAALKLHTIQSNEALPMVLFKRRKSNEIYMPDKLYKVTLLDGKMIYGTTFLNKLPTQQQMFFCPKQNTDEKCLVPKTFEGTDRLQCTLEPTPTIQRENITCGEDEMGNIYTSLYIICLREDFQLTLPFYSFCYVTKIQKTLFTIHTILSPELLSAKLLLREREVNYRIMEKDEFDVFRSPELNDVEFEEESKPHYKRQKLVPSQDMALGLWRKTTFQQTNTALQHEQLTSVWDKITEYVRFNAIKMYNENNTQTMVYTGIIDVDSARKDHDGDQLFNIWVKLVVAGTESMKHAAQASYGVAILMNNFIGDETSSTTFLKSKVIEEYCELNICIDDLSNELKQIGGHVRCCLVNEKILGLFNEKDTNLPELQILNINVTEDPETLEDDIYMTEEHAANSIREIQHNEILPLTLISKSKNSDFYFPTDIGKLEIKRRRIVNGSQFFDNTYERQLFFCPKENSNENCLEPRTFGRFEPLQCTKEFRPAARQLSTSSNNCGINKEGTLYQVVYEICPSQQPYQYTITGMKLYEFCYDTKRKRILHVHHKIMSRRLLITDLLLREREVEYDMMTDIDCTSFLSNYKELVEATQKENENSTSSTHTKNSSYKLQKFVPPQDMAFASWKKSTYQYVNVALQHESLIPLWNEINASVNYNAYRIQRLRVQNLIYNHSDDSIYTGVLYKQSSSEDDMSDQIPEIWFKIIHTEKSIPHRNRMKLTQDQEGIVILVSNFLIPKTDDSTSSKREENTLKEYCKDNLCMKEFQNKFEQIGGQVCCCRLTIQIAQLLGIQNINRDYAVRSMHDIVSLGI